MRSRLRRREGRRGGARLNPNERRRAPRDGPGSSRAPLPQRRTWDAITHVRAHTRLEIHTNTHALTHSHSHTHRRKAVKDVERVEWWEEHCAANAATADDDVLTEDSEEEGGAGAERGAGFGQRWR